MNDSDRSNGHDTSNRALSRQGRVLPVKLVAARWACSQDRPFALVQAALQTLARAGEAWRVLPWANTGLGCVREASALVARGECDGIVLFCADPALAACVANKMPGLRAAAVTTVSQAAQATLSMAANFLAVEMPGRTFFEIRHILRTLRSNRLACPADWRKLFWRWNPVRIAEVIGTVTLSRAHPSLVGARWLIGVPFSLEGLKADRPDGEDLVIYDDLGAGAGTRIGFSEGGEAAVPFYPDKKPIDAYCALLIDKLVIV